MKHVLGRQIGLSLILIFLGSLLLISVLMAVSIGPVSISLTDIWHVVAYHFFGWYETSTILEGYEEDIIWNLRMPRVMLAVIVGVGLSISGTVMQAIVRNILADPYILGLSSGASLGATLAIMIGVGTFLGNEVIGGCAFLGALLAAFFVLLLSGHSASPVKLLLSGMVISAICSAISSFIIFFADNKEGMQSITFWLMGSLSNATWNQISFLFSLTIIFSGVIWLSSKILNMMLVGDEAAITMGISLELYRKIYIVVVSLIVGFIVYASGMIGFVGLIIPHCVRSVIGTNHWRLLPVVALVGAIFMVWADILCRMIIPGSEMPIGVLIAIVSAPFFIYLLVHKMYGFGG